MIGIGQEVETVDAMGGAPVERLGHDEFIQTRMVQTRDAWIEEIRIPFEIGADFSRGLRRPGVGLISWSHERHANEVTAAITRDCSSSVRSL